MEQVTEVPKELIRIDQNIAMSGIDLLSTYGDQASMILDILVYNAQKQQKDLFNFETFSVAEFANLQGYKKANLLREHPNPEQASRRNIKKLSEEERFTNVVENALFVMGARNLEFSKLRKDFSSGETVASVNFYQVLTNLNKHILKRKDQHYYTYTFSEKFKAHINRYFTQIDPKMMAVLRKPNLGFLYLNFTSLRDTVLQKGEQAKPRFDHLLELTKINSTDPANQKKRLREKLRLLRDLTELSYDFDFFNLSGNYKFGVKIEFQEPTDMPAKKETLESAMNNHITMTLRDYYINCVNVDQTFNKADFSTWFFDSSKDLGVKFKAYFTAHHLIRNSKSIKDSERICQQSARDYFNRKETV